MKQSLKDKFNALEPDKRRKVLIGSVLGAALFLMSAVVIITDDSSSRNKPDDVTTAEDVSNVLMSTGGREIGLAGVSNDIEKLAADVAALRAENERLAFDLEKQKQAPRAPLNPDDALESLSAQVGKERGDIGPPGTVFNDERPAAPNREFRKPTITGPSQRAPEIPAELPDLTPPTINTTVSKPAVSAVRARLENVYLPTGTIMTGVLLNGLDAPTGRSAQSAPIPVLVRVKHEAILPSRYSSDVKEAFILAAGFGDLSSERAYLRAERLSMILRNGEIIDLPIKMSAVGGDGKSGLRGRIVSKQGAVIGKALLAGVADGISKAFSGSGSNFGGSVDLPSTDEVMMGGLGGGATGALDRIASYFLSQAEAMYPVVEVGAGREVSLVLLEGLELAPRVPPEEKESATPSSKTSTATASR